MRRAVPLRLTQRTSWGNLPAHDLAVLARCALLASTLTLLGTVAHGGSSGAPVRAPSSVDLGFSKTSAAIVNDAVGRIRRSVDPCGESAEVIAALDELRSCAKARYAIRISSTAARNLFDRPIGPHRKALPRTITWNPGLRSELEPSCDGDPGRPVVRDPTASLLHELVHAAQDCRGLNPGEYELEAVRIENIYRRAAGLCQRRGYGDDLLPLEMVKTCAPAACGCSTPHPPDAASVKSAAAAVEAQRAAASGETQVGDSTVPASAAAPAW